MIELKTKIESYTASVCGGHTFFGEQVRRDISQNIKFSSGYEGHSVLLELNGVLALECNNNNTYFITIESEKERKERLEAEAMIISIFNCSSCGQTHRDLKIQKLSKVSSLGSHWISCPVNGDPVFIKFEETEEENCNKQEKS